MIGSTRTRDADLSEIICRIVLGTAVEGPTNKSALHSLGEVVSYS